MLAEQIGHSGDIGQMRHIGERKRLVGEQAGGHQWQGSVLGAADADFALERRAAANAHDIHDVNQLT